MPRQKIIIDPVTRIEGHSKITIHLDEHGSVEEAYFHVTQFRGFEKFCEGRPFSEMPSLMARICGICPVSHLIASAKACDEILAVRIPANAARLRRVMNLAQIVQSHALSFFYLALPDLLLGMDSDPGKRNVFGVMDANPAMAREGIRLRQFGQQVIESLGGKRIHPAWVVPGGVSEPLTAEHRDRILAGIPEALAIAGRTLDWFKSQMEGFREEIRTFANMPTLFMGLVGEGGALDHYDGKLRFLDAGGHIVADGIEPADYASHIVEMAHPWTYLKTSYYKPLGYPAGIYRVGPLARLNLIDKCGTPRAGQEWAEFRELDRGAVLSSFYYHYARLIEILFAIEEMERLLTSPDILDTHVRSHARPNNSEGVGISEAPRGTLIHHYKVDRDGLITWANLIIATGTTTPP
jgi:NAD-reducing hydrogenase large subunit